jgi:hypothetical protein
METNMHKGQRLIANLSMLLVIFFSGCPATNTNQPGKKYQADADGFVRIFNGKTLAGWQGDPTYWRVEDGCIIGEITPATRLKHNSFLIWRGAMPPDFELKVKYKVSPAGNSGINYRSAEVPGIPYALRGYQADLDGAQRYTGSNYEERGRTTLASRGQKVVLETPYALPDSGPSSQEDSLRAYIQNNRWIKARVIASLGHIDSLKKHIKVDDWNEYHLIVQGNRLRHYINGHLMSDVTDNDTINRRTQGLMGVQVHVGPPMTIAYRHFLLKKL